MHALDKIILNHASYSLHPLTHSFAHQFVQNFIHSFHAGAECCEYKYEWAISLKELFCGYKETNLHFVLYDSNNEFNSLDY